MSLDTADVVSLYRAGLSLAEIARMKKTSKQLVDYYLAKVRCPRRPRGRLSHRDVKRARDMRSAGVTLKEIAREFGVTHQAIAWRVGPRDGHRRAAS